MKKLGYAFFAVGGLSVAIVFVTLNLSVQQLVDFNALGVQVENIQDARVKSGRLKIQSGQFAELGVFDIAWHWCPARGLLNWCAELQSSSLEVQGQLGYKLAGAVSLYALRVDLKSLSLLGVLPGLVDAQLRGQIESMQITDFNCPLRDSRGLTARFVVVEPQILGNSLADINASIEQRDESIYLNLSSDQLQGGFQLDNQLLYEGEGEITPPPNLAGLMDSMAIPLGNGRYGWKLSGEVPC